ncbi:hypothetical protein ZYGR_0W00860 [Zygosaccharomyces rouxii]|uniref:Protein SNA2 n=1 Tax=Zygosaccharomyces rouxii TaxID=4956 RepID=B2G408_ZYGRO|nr:hypothetical protein ZYGR_0W00860 [Zygosaccharomyces rouxii]CAQ43317.1 Protein SNA2 [Zygosaccharomyces rouxii]
MTGRFARSVIYNEFVLVFVSVFVPSVAVVMKRGFSRDLLVNVLLYCIGFFPGLLHALWIIAQRREVDKTPRVRRHRTRYGTV